MNRRQDQIRGCLLGAAAGDALGYCVNDLSLGEIREQYGPDGIQGYDSFNGWALISCHTQMAMYTANGLLFGATRGATRGRMAPYVQYLAAFYQEWATTQRYSAPGTIGRHYGWITTIPEMHARRNPDKMTLFAMERQKFGTLAEPVNRSRSPIAVTRSIPVGLFLNPRDNRPAEIRLLGAESAALTVGDPLGYLPAAYLAEILNQLIYGKPDNFRAALRASHKAMAEQFGTQYPQLEELRSLLQKAEILSAEPLAAETAMERLNPQESASVLAAACYVALKFPGDFDRGIVAAVNHSGAGAAVGAVAGALLGAQIGTEGIPEFYLEPLEFRPILEELADDLYQGCPMAKSANLFDDQWDTKYVQCTYLN